MGKFCLVQGVFFTGSALKVLSMELVPPNREMTGASWVRLQFFLCNLKKAGRRNLEKGFFVLRSQANQLFSCFYG